MEIICSHVNADFDALAAMVAAQKIYPEARIVFSGTQNRNVREFISLHRDVIDYIEPKNLNRKEVTRLIVVDTRIADRLGELEDLAYQSKMEIFTFDHHPPTPEDMAVTRDFSEIIGATTTTMIKIIRDKKLELTPFEATLFALGIHEDTGSLTYPTTTYADAEAITYLMLEKANTGVISYFLNMPLTREQHELLNVFLKQSRLINVSGVDVLFSSAEVKDYVDGASVLTHKLGDLENVDIVFTFLMMKDRIHIIARSRVNDVSVASVLGAFEGGGHPQAASAVVRETDLKKVERQVIEELTAHLHRPLTAKEIMSKPVQTIEQSTTVREANKLMLKFGHTGLPVIDKGKLVGIISRRDVEKAVHHNLSHAPVKGFMSHQVLTVTPDTPLHRIQALLTEEEIGRLPVVENGEIIGIVTRTDALRSLHGREYLSRETPKVAQGISRGEIVERLKSLAPRHIQELLKQIGILAEHEKVDVYLVGGFVRDLLLNTPNLDVDIVVEGDGLKFARKMFDRFGGRLRAHKKFGTAVVVLPDGFHIDVASARTELYEHPAALPQVELSLIKQDLARRDFTINTMAIALNTSRFGQLLDFFGGQRDLQDKRVRVLHNLSFVEDPTRIFRAVRFEQRHGFKIEAQTESLARQAVAMDLIGKLTGSRIREELIALLSEETAYSALVRLADLGVLRLIHPKLSLNNRAKKLFGAVLERSSQLELYFSVKPKCWLVYLIILLAGLQKEEIEDWCFEMKMRRVDTEVLKEGVVGAPKILKSLSRTAELKNSSLYSLLKGRARETIIFLYFSGSSKVRERIDFYLSSLQRTRIFISGRDLIELGFEPSPLINQTLREVLTAKLDGQVKAKEDELKLAKKILARLRLKLPTSLPAGAEGTVSRGKGQVANSKD